MADTPVNNKKFVLNPVNIPKIDVGESTIFSKKVDANLWETAAKQILSQSLGNKLDING